MRPMPKIFSWCVRQRCAGGWWHHAPSGRTCSVHILSSVHSHHCLLCAVCSAHCLQEACQIDPADLENDEEVCATFLYAYNAIVAAACPLFWLLPCLQSCRVACMFHRRPTVGLSQVHRGAKVGGGRRGHGLSHRGNAAPHTVRDCFVARPRESMMRSWAGGFVHATGCLGEHARQRGGVV